MSIGPRHKPWGAWLLACGLLTLLSWLIPPLQSPDEFHHLARAEALSRGSWLLDTPPSPSATVPSISGAPVDRGLLAFMQPFESVIRKVGHTFSADELKALEAIRWSEHRHFYPMPGTGYYLPVIYLPQALGFATGRLLDWGVATTYRWVRLCTLLSTLGLLAWACTLWRPNLATWALLFLPMSLFQGLSPVIDGPATALAVVCLALYMRGLSADATARRPLHPLTLCALLLVLTGSRVQLLPMLALPLHLAWVRRSWAWAGGGLLTTGLVLAWTLFTMATVVDPRVPKALGATDLLQVYATHPTQFLGVLWRTLSDPDRLRFYWQSFIGILGWLDAPMLHWSYPVLSAGLLISVGHVAWQRRHQASSPVPVWPVLAALASAGLVFLALLLAWTPYPARQIEGVQGRYFLIPCITLVFCWTAPAPASPRKFTLAYWGLAVFVLLSAMALIHTLRLRYPTQYLMGLPF